MVHRYIQWTCNLMAEIVSEILSIKKTNGEDQTDWESINKGSKKKILELRDQIENNK